MAPQQIWAGTHQGISWTASIQSPVAQPLVIFELSTPQHGAISQITAWWKATGWGPRGRWYPTRPNVPGWALAAVEAVLLNQDGEVGL